MTAVAGLRGTGDWATDERPKNFRELILFRNPNGTAPLFALTAKMAEESVNDPEFAWWDEPADLVRVRLNGALTNVATAAVVDSGDPTAAFPDGGDAAGTNVGWGNATHLKPGDLLMYEIAVETADPLNEIVMVTAVASATAFTIARGQAGTTAAAMADNGYLLKVGSAYSEGDVAPSATTRNPIKFFNYTQIFKSAYEITRTASKTKTRTGDPIANDKKRKIFDHSRDIEMAFMFGQRFETTGTNGKPLRMTGGLRDFISQTTTTIFAATTTLTQFLTATYRVFDWDTPAGNERIAFCGNNYLNQLNLLARLNSQVYFEGIVRQYGLELRTFSLPQGTLFLKTHPLMNRHPQYTSSAFLIDASALKYRYITDTFFEDDIQTPGQDSRKGQWLTECGLEYRFAGRTLGYHGNFIAPA
jgi:Family of unknown function (DUF5309)